MGAVTVISLLQVIGRPACGLSWGRIDSGPRAEAAVVHQSRFNFISEARNLESAATGAGNPSIRLPERDCPKAEFFEIMEHPFPADREAARALSRSPAALDLRQAMEKQKISKIEMAPGMKNEPHRIDYSRRENASVRLQNLTRGARLGASYALTLSRLAIVST